MIVISYISTTLLKIITSLLLIILWTIIMRYGQLERLVYYAGVMDQYGPLIHHFVQVIVIQVFLLLLVMYVQFNLSAEVLYTTTM